MKTVEADDVDLCKEFEFYFSGDDENVIMKADIYCPDGGDVDAAMIELESTDAYDDFREDMEKTYGVHDYSCSPTTQVAGYTSYEVDEDLQTEVFMKWLEYFLASGFMCKNLQRTQEDVEED